MKHIVTTFLVTLVFFSCKKDNNGPKLEKTFPGSMETGYLEANRDGGFWQSTALAQYGQTAHLYVVDSTHLGFTCLTYSAEGFNREWLTLGEIPIKVGKYPINGGNAISVGLDGFVGAQYSWLADDGDVAGADYYYDENAPGILEVTFVDTATKRIAGNFNKLVFKNRFDWSIYPGVVVFENGKFDMKITE